MQRGESATRAEGAAQACPASGLLAVAHEKGEVRLYQFSDAARDVTCLHLTAAPTARCACALSAPLQLPASPL